MERLDKILSSQNEQSRTESRQLIRSGKVCVNGSVCRDPSYKLSPEQNDITINRKPLFYKKNIYIMLNKPAGILCVSRDPKAKTVVDLLPAELKRKGLFPAGRLDKDTVGLVIITDDGDFAHRMLSPRKSIFKHYQAIVDGPIDETHKQRFEEGIVLADDTVCLPAKLNVIHNEENPLVDVEICEGKFHQIKRMFVAVGRKVLWLKRISIGGLMLDEKLHEGEYRELSESEKTAIFR